MMIAYQAGVTSGSHVGINWEGIKAVGSMMTVKAITVHGIGGRQISYASSATIKKLKVKMIKS